MANKKSSVMTTSWGHPVDDNQNSLTAGPRGPILLTDSHLVDKLQSFDRERIPERAVHARGAGAHGFFEVTNDVTRYCKAKFLEKLGKKTPVFLRFSTVGGERGSTDTERDPRGYAVKFYTEEGNFDIAGNNTPVFGIRNPLQFPEFQHIQKKDPVSNLKSGNMYWDFHSLVPESCHQLTYLFGPRGTPDGYRHLNGYGSHTFKWVNSKSEEFLVKYHFHSEVGTKNLSFKDAVKLMGEDPDYATRDLYNHIASGKEAAWKFSVQVIPIEEGENYKWDVYDITKVWPHSDYPLIEVGRVILNRNPSNYFAEVEQAAFSPSNIVPGIEPSNDPVLQARMFSYPDTQRHRLGANFMQIPVNCPYMTRVSNYQRDGPACSNGNQGSEANYEPNSIEDTPKPAPEFSQKQYKVQGLAGRHRYQHPNSDYEQAGTLYRRVFTDDMKSDLISNLTGNMKRVTRNGILERQQRIFYRCDPEYGTRLAQALNLPVHQAKL